MKINNLIILNEFFFKCVDYNRSFIISEYLSQLFHNVVNSKLLYIFSLQSLKIKLQELLKATKLTHIICNLS
jgi:hypothetical protein